MKTMKLMQMSIRNFKGCAALDLALSGRSASIYGDNAAGKTTVFDALTWLLFGKDSRDRKDFEIKPLDSAGSIKDHAAVTGVEATFEVNECEIRLKKTFFERWSTKRGSVDATYDGNTSEYYVDDVPAKKYEYERRVSEIVSEDLFRVLTNCLYFCETMGWKERRKMLLDVCDIPDDKVIMVSSPVFAPLLQALGNLSLDDYRKKLMAQRKGLNGARDTVPARIDEQKKTVEALSGMDFAGIEAQKAEKAVHLGQLKDELIKMEHGALMDSKCNERDNLKNQLQALGIDNDRHRASQMGPIMDERPAMRARLQDALRKKEYEEAQVQMETKAVERINARIEEMRQRWISIDAEQFTGGTCPTCGQALPEAALNAAMERFAQDKERRKADAVSTANREKETLQTASERLARHTEEVKAAEEAAATVQAELEAYIPAAQPEITDLPGYQEKADQLRASIGALESVIEKMKGETAAIQAEISGKIRMLSDEIAALDAELAKKPLLTFAQERISELREEAKQAAESIETLDRSLALVDEFTRHKCSFIEDGINSRFKLAKFKLFSEQINGGVSDCCEATYDGVPFDSLNNGMRINLGVDVIRTISEYYGLRVPLFVDNAESVVDLVNAETQVIRLVVSGKDKELRIEYEN